MADNRQVLPTNVVPSHYTVALQPDLEEHVFLGQEEIVINVVEATATIVLHSKDIEVSEAVFKRGGMRTPASDISYNVERELLTLSFAAGLSPTPRGTADSLVITFTGILNDKMAGFYRSEYTTPEGETRFLATTQFEATDARRAFPCWDEPAVKATFDIRLTVPEDRVALSNMNIISERQLGDSGLKEVRYATTPRMSTYLVAFVVGEFEYVEDYTTEGVRVRVYTPMGKKEEGRFALGVATKALSFLATYFDVPFPLPKCDMIAIPDFAAGAMENWGLITYRTVLVLYNEKTTPASLKQRIAYVVCHELTHQWFGNIVTMEWWSDLWLNEGFATWAGWRATDDIFPEWHVWDQFVSNDLQRALNLDGLKSSHPVEVEIEDANKVDEIFDAISYSKGASVIRMLVAWLGEDAFQAGMRVYLKRHLYGNAATKDLWAALSDTTGEPVGEVMQTWTKETGYPVVTVSKRDDGCLVVSQARFLTTGPDASETTLWPIPLRIKSGIGAVDNTFVMRDQSEVLDIGGDAAGNLEAAIAAQGAIKWHLGNDTEIAAAQDLLSVLAETMDGAYVKLNSGEHSFFVVEYDASLVPDLVRAIPNLPVTDRVGIVANAFRLASAGYGSATVALELLSAYEGETSFVVLSEISSHLGTMRSVWYEHDDDVAALRKISQRIFGPVAARLGWLARDGEDALTPRLRALAIANAGAAGDQEVLAEAAARFSAFLAGDVDALETNLRAPVFRMMINANGDEAWEAVKNYYETVESSDQKLVALGTLGSGETKELILKALNYTLTSAVRSQDVFYIISSAGSNRHGRDLTWEFVKDQWELLCDRYLEGAFLLGRIVSMAIDNFSSQAKIDDINAFFAEHPTKEIDRTVRQSLEKVGANAAWLDRDGAAVSDWLAAN